MTARAVAAIGVGQCVNWGVLYYAFGVLLLPVERELGVPRWVVAGAFSASLLIAAAVAPAAGRRVDRGHGPALMRAGGLIAAGLLLLWAAVPGLFILYAVWAGLGLCMAAVLYEPAFGIVGRAFDAPRDRLRALATVTVLGGLASTIFLPYTAALVERFGWRGAAVWLAGTLAASTAAVSSVAFRRSTALTPGTSGDRHEQGPGMRGAGRGCGGAEQAPTSRAPEPEPRAPDLGPRVHSAIRADLPLQPATSDVRRLLLVFSGTSLVSAAITTNIVPAFVERDLTPAAAAMLAGLFGLMQLPGRALLMSGHFAAAPSRLLTGSLLLQAGGLAVLISASSPPAVAAGVSLFACGAGLTTLVRPHLVQTLYTIDRAGHMNGVVARAQLLARAGGPVAAAALWAVGGYGLVFGLFAGLLLCLAVTSPLSLTRPMAPQARASGRACPSQLEAHPQ